MKLPTITIPALFCIAVGILPAVVPYRFAQFEERVHSIGSTRRWSEVKPADWKVKLTRAVGIIFVFIGLGLLDYT